MAGTRYKRMHSSANILVGNLALADLIMSSLDAAFVAVASFHGGWIFGSFGCKAYAYSVSMVSILSISTLTLIAIDRYVVIVKCWVNYRRSRKKTAVWFLSIAWFNAIFWATCPLIGWGAFMLEGFGTSCTFDYLTRSPNNTSYVICINIFAFFVPVTIISVCYVNIIRAMYKHKKDMKNVLQMLGPNPRFTRGKKLNVELKTARALAIAIVLFCAGWAPYAIISLIGQFGDRSLISRITVGLPGIAAKCMTSLNPFLYAISNPIFLRKMKEILCCRVANNYDSAFPLIFRRVTKTLRPNCIDPSSADQKNTTWVQKASTEQLVGDTCGSHGAESSYQEKSEPNKTSNVILQEPIVDAGSPNQL